LIVVVYAPVRPPDAIATDEAASATDEAASMAMTRATTASDRYRFVSIIDFLLLRLTYAEARRPGRTAHRRHHQRLLGAGTEIR
jgi:hypothetical protein